MLSKLKSFFATELEVESEATREEKLQQACAVLLIEVCKADNDESLVEKKEIRKLLGSVFNIEGEPLDALIAQSADQEVDSTSFYPFTKLINDHYDYPERVNVIKLMWKVAYADGTIDKYEDYIIRKVADLLYVSHSDFIQAKLSAEPQ
ncbi:TerB family tellurite resistance protein [Alteromonadaceae bacterium M269]|nr:TerB family tellurite resistance protein [Alteromonadaceae bacterium M269]